MTQGHRDFLYYMAMERKIAALPSAFRQIIKLTGFKIFMIPFILLYGYWRSLQATYGRMLYVPQSLYSGPGISTHNHVSKQCHMISISNQEKY